MQLNTLTPEIFTIDNFWTPGLCRDFILKTEGIGYGPATITTEKGPRRVDFIRNNNRVIYSDTLLAGEIWEQAKDFIPPKVGNSNAAGMNELFRFYKYQPGQQFRRHRDESYIRNEKEASYFTFMIYLNDDYEGGETTFNSVTIQPKQGMALLFRHPLEHEGSTVTKGIKYVLRTDIMYRLQEE